MILNSMFRLIQVYYLCICDIQVAEMLQAGSIKQQACSAVNKITDIGPTHFPITFFTNFSIYWQRSQFSLTQAYLWEADTETCRLWVNIVWDSTEIFIVTDR
jgi:hypothetical protein